MPEKTNMNEMKVNVRDLWLTILLCWRFIIIVSCIAGILGMCFAVISAYKEGKAAGANTVELTGELQDKLASIKALQSSYDEQQRYLSESILMNIDPLHEWVYTSQYYITMDPGLPAQPNINAVISYYLAEIQTEETCEAVRAAIGEDMSSAHLTELIQTSNIGNNCFSFTIYYHDAEKVRKMGEAVDKVIVGKKAAVVKTFGAHSLDSNGISCYERYDGDLMVTQKNKVNDASTILNSITTIQKGYTEEEKELLDAYESSQNSVPSTGKVNVVTAILFFIGGALLSLFMLLIHYIFSGRIHSADTLWQDNHIYDMGIVSDRKDKKASAIDTFLIKTFSPYLYHMLATDPAIVAYRLKDTASNANVQTLYVTSSMAESQIEGALKKLTEALGGTDLSVAYLPNIVYDTTAFQTACQEGSVLLLEQSGSSYREEILRIMDTCQNHQIKILGAVTWVVI